MLTHPSANLPNPGPCCLTSVFLRERLSSTENSKLVLNTLVLVRATTTSLPSRGSDLQELNQLDDKSPYMIGYFETRDSPAYENFRKSAMNLKDDCKFVAGFGDVVARMHPPGHDIIAFRWGGLGEFVSLWLGLATWWRACIRHDMTSLHSGGEGWVSVLAVCGWVWRRGGAHAPARAWHNCIQVGSVR